MNLQTNQRFLQLDRDASPPSPHETAPLVASHLAENRETRPRRPLHPADVRMLLDMENHPPPPSISGRKARILRKWPPKATGFALTCARVSRSLILIDSRLAPTRLPRHRNGSTRHTKHSAPVSIISRGGPSTRRLAGRAFFDGERLPSQSEIST